MDTQPTIKNFLIIALPVVLTIFIIFFLVMPQVQENRASQNNENNNAEQVIGGDRDESGCLGSAGYSWSEEAGACLREWEMTGEESKRAVKIAVDYLGWSSATVLEVTQARCPGCFVVKLENNATQDRKNINLDNWEVGETSLTPAECLELGGQPVNTVGGATCSAGEKNTGEVTGFISPNICCVPLAD